MVFTPFSHKYPKCMIYPSISRTVLTLVGLNITKKAGSNEDHRRSPEHQWESSHPAELSNVSLEAGKLPHDWRSVKLVHVHKNVGKDTTGNCLRISSLSAVLKRMADGRGTYKIGIQSSFISLDQNNKVSFEANLAPANCLPARLDKGDRVSIYHLGFL